MTRGIRCQVAYGRQSGTMAPVRTATTMGFSVEERDKARLEHLTDTFGGGNRSAFLRVALDVMERLELVQRIGRLQAYGAARLAESGFTVDDIPDIVNKALDSRDPAAVAQARLVVAGISKDWRAPQRPPGGESDKLRQAFTEALAETSPES